MARKKDKDWEKAWAVPQSNIQPKVNNTRENDPEWAKAWGVKVKPQPVQEIDGSDVGGFKTLERDQPGPTPKKAGIGKTVATTAGLGLLKGGAQIGALAEDLLMGPYDILAKGEPAFNRSRNFEQTWDTTVDPLKERLGTKDSTLGEVIEGIGSLIPSIAISGGITKATGYAPMVKELGEQAAEKLGGKVLGKGAQKAVQSSPDMLNTWLMTEAAKPAEERTSLPVWAAEWVAGDAALGLAGKGLAKAGTALKGKLGKGAKVEPTIEEPDLLLDDLDGLDEIFTPTQADFTVEPTGRTHIGEPQAELPAGQQPLAIEGRTPLALEAGEQPLALEEGKIPNWDYYKPTRFQATSDGKVMDMEEGSFPPARIEGRDYASDMGLKGKQRLFTDTDQPIPRSDIGDPEYLASLEKRYGELVDEEVNNIKGDIQGVLKLGNADDGYYRASLNPKWYRDYYKEAKDEPHAGEYRDMAINNLIKGNSMTGEPANEEFLSILSELSRGQKLPEEWHGLQQGIRELESSKSEYAPETTPTNAAPKEPWQMTNDTIELKDSGKKSREALGDIYANNSSFNEYENLRNKIKNPLVINPEQITRQEFYNRAKYLDGFDKGLYDVLGTIASNNKLPNSGLRSDMELHYGLVKKALNEGKPVPEEVLKDYPDLAAKYPQANSNNGIESLIGEMQAEQAKVEPYGLNRDLNRLNDVENGIRGKTRMKDMADYGQYNDAKFKYASSTAKKATSDANKAFEIDAKDPDRITYDESAFDREDIQLADKVANALSGTSVVPAKMPSFMEKVQGFFDLNSKKIFLNSKMDDPATYVATHEVGHKMELEHPEAYGKMLDIAVNNLKDDHKALIERYQKRGYEITDMPDEYFADLMAEMLHDKSFVGKLRDNAPEVIQPLLQVLDEVIQKVKLALSKDDSVLPFIENLERLRSELAPEYQGYLETVGNQQNAGIRKGWQTPEGIAAKQGLGKGATKVEPTSLRSDIPGVSLQTVDGYTRLWLEGKGQFGHFDTPEEAMKFAEKHRDTLSKYQWEGNISEETPDNIRYLSEAISKDYANYERSKSKQTSLDVILKNIDNYRREDLESLAEQYSQGSWDDYKDLSDKELTDALKEALGERISELSPFELQSPKFGYYVRPAKTAQATNPDIRFKIASSEQPSSLQRIADITSDVAGRIPQGLTLDDFTKEITAQYPNISKAVPYIWQQAKKLADTGRAEVSYRGESIPLGKELGRGATTPISPIGTKGKAVQPEFGQGSGIMNESQFKTNTMTNSEFLQEPEIQKVVQDAEMLYEVKPNEQSIQRANDMVQKDFWGTVDRISKEGLQGAEDAVASGIITNAMRKEAQTTGDYAQLTDWLKTVQPKVTDVAQTLQALSTWKSMTVEGALNMAARVTNTADKVIKDANKFAGKKVELTPDDVKYITEQMSIVEQMPEGTEIEIRAKEIEFAKVKKYIADKVPSTLAEKIKGLQRIAMLLNPKTIVSRNTLGNTILGGFETLKDVPGTLADMAMSNVTGQRTTLMPSAEGFKTLGKGAKKGFEQVTEDIKAGVDTSPTRGQYELPSHRIFKNPILNGLDQATTRALQYGDRPFFQAAYDETLRQQMKIAGVDTPTDAMKEMAMNVAKDRTFQNDSYIAKKVEQLRGGLNVLGTDEFGLGNVIIPFSKTPSNIIDKAVDYSPVGFIRAGIEATKLKKGTFDQKRFVDIVGRSVTGTGLIMLGYDLAKKGVITGNAPKDKDAAAMNRDVGLNPYSFNASAAGRLFTDGDPTPQEGDKLRTYDYAQPISVALAIGADLFKAGKDRKETSNIVYEALKSGGQTILNQSLLQGVTKMLGGYDAMGNILDSVFEFPLQFAPSIFGQAARVIDDKARETYDPSLAQTIVNKGKTKIPFVRNTMYEKVGTLGKVPSSVAGGNSLFNTFFNPGTTQKYNPSPAQEMVLDIYNKTGETIQFPRVVLKTVNGKALTPKELHDYQLYVGQRTANEFNLLANDGYFRSLDPTEQAKELQKILTDINAEAKEEVLKIEPKGKTKGYPAYAPW